MAQDLFGGLAEGLASGQQIKARREQMDMARQQQAQEMQLQQAKLGMAQDQLSMEKEKWGYQKRALDQAEKDNMRQAQIQQGLNDAFSSGGYEGAMDYLKHTDMQTYMAIADRKAKVDKSIADAGTSEYASEKARQDAVANGYAVLGKMGATILKADPADQPKVYQSILPMIKSIYKDAPDEYNDDAKALLMVSMGVAAPASQLFAAEKKNARAQTAIGKIQNDILKLKDQGLTDDDPTVKALQSQLKAEIDNSTDAQLNAAKNAPNEDALRNQYINVNKNFIAIRDQWTQVQSYNDKNATPMGDMKLIYAFNKLMNPNDSVKEGEFANTTNAAGWSDRMRNEYNKAIKGNMLSPALRNDMLKQGANLYESYKTNYEGLKAQYTDIAVRRGLDPKNVVLDLDVQNQAAASGPPPDWAAKAKMLNPGMTDADIAAAWAYKQKGSQSAAPAQQGAPQQQAAPQQQPVGEGNPPWQAGRSMAQ